MHSVHVAMCVLYGVFFLLLRLLFFSFFFFHRVSSRFLFFSCLYLFMSCLCCCISAFAILINFFYVSVCLLACFCCCYCCKCHEEAKKKRKRRYLENTIRNVSPGDFSVGRVSLYRQFIHSSFSICFAFQCMLCSRLFLLLLYHFTRSMFFYSLSLLMQEANGISYLDFDLIPTSLKISFRYRFSLLASLLQSDN